MTYYIFRHGQTYFSKNHVAYEAQQTTAELLPEGVKQTHKMAKKLIENNVTVFYCSPLRRCVQTLELLKKDIPNLKVTFFNELTEGNVFKSNETIADLSNRAKFVLNQANPAGLSKIGICTHGVMVGVLTALLKKGRVTEDDTFNYPPCGDLVVIAKYD